MHNSREGRSRFMDRYHAAAHNESRIGFEENSNQKMMETPQTQAELTLHE